MTDTCTYDSRSSRVTTSGPYSFTGFPTQQPSQIASKSPLESYADAAMECAVVRKTDAGTFIAEIPGFDGVWTDGKTEEETIVELREVLLDWIEIKTGAGGGGIPVIAGLNLNIL